MDLLDKLVPRYVLINTRVKRISYSTYECDRVTVERVKICQGNNSDFIYNLIMNVVFVLKD